IKLTLGAPNWYHLPYKERGACLKNVYKSDAECFHYITVRCQTELNILYEAGLRNFQNQDKTNSTTINGLFDAYINLLNECISKAPVDLYIGIHLCRDNPDDSRHFSKGGYDRISKLFGAIILAGRRKRERNKVQDAHPSEVIV
ncbi:hypothetical protein K432DRAFT_289162, partial [Lepidopterella palustris CBS 459.81]